LTQQVQQLRDLNQKLIHEQKELILQGKINMTQLSEMCQEQMIKYTLNITTRK